MECYHELWAKNTYLPKLPFVRIFQHSNRKETRTFCIFVNTDFSSFKLVIWEFPTLCFDIFTPPTLFRSHPTLYHFFLKPLRPLCVVKLFLIIWLYGLSSECGQTTRGHILRENTLSSSQCLTIVTSSTLWVGLHSLIPSPYWDLVGYGLYTFCVGSHNYSWVHKYSFPAVSLRHCFLVVTHNLWLFHFQSLPFIFSFYY